MAREYKDSGIEWIGDIPKEWEVRRIKSIFTERTELSENGDETLLSVSEYYGVANRKDKIEDGEFVSRAESLVGYKKCYEGDLVSNIMLAWKGSLGVTDIDGIVSPAYCVYKPSKEIFPHYYHYLFRTSLFTSIFRLFSKGIIDSRLRLYSPYFYAISTLFPPLLEQQKIAEYLDKVCGEVDELVALQEKMIEELKAYKQSVITEAVTKGLNPNVPMKDSGIDWIGEVPEGWKVCKLKNVYQLLNGRAYLDPELLEEGKYRILRVGNLFSSDKWYYSDMELEDNKYCQSGDLLYGWSASIGPYIWEGEKVIYHYHIWKVLFSNNNLHFSYYLLYALTLAKQRDMHGSAMQHLTKTNMDNSFIALPPLSEQQSIASYLDTKCTEIDALIAIKQSKIDELKEYKKSVIYEYVTGKKEVVWIQKQ
ncbi:MAG: restriction endonuclease subunit S [Bacteroidaceae bacterium]|nr:restriction endonuclease subunit S [Bacteroidaceae bacterium]